MDFDEPETHRRVINEIEQQQDDAAAAERDEAARAALAGAARARIINPDPARRVRQRRGNVVIVDLTGQESLTNNVVDLSQKKIRILSQNLINIVAPINAGSLQHQTLDNFE